MELKFFPPLNCNFWLPDLLMISLLIMSFSILLKPQKESESEVAQWCLTLWDPMDCSLKGSSVHGIFQARILEWIAISFLEFLSKASSSSTPTGSPETEFPQHRSTFVQISGHLPTRRWQPSVSLVSRPGEMASEMPGNLSNERHDSKEQGTWGSAPVSSHPVWHGEMSGKCYDCSLTHWHYILFYERISLSPKNSGAETTP